MRFGLGPLNETTKLGLLGELDTNTINALYFVSGTYLPDLSKYFGRIYISDVDAASPTIGIEVSAPAASTMQALIELLPTGTITFSNGFGASSTTRSFGPTAFTENGALVNAGYFQLSSVVSPAQLTADQNNYNPGGWDSIPPDNRNSWFRLSSDASRNITGLQAPPVGFEQGFVCLLHNIGSNNIVLIDESGLSTAGNRFALAGDITLTPDSCAILQYDNTTTRWRAIGRPGSSPLTTKGDLFTYSTTDARLAAGTNGTFPMYDSTQATGLAGAVTPGHPQSKAINYTTLNTDGSVLVDASGGARTITLESAGSCPNNRIQIIVKVDSSANAVTVAAGGSDTINGVATFVLTAQYSSVTLMTDGSASWFVVAET